MKKKNVIDGSNLLKRFIVPTRKRTFDEGFSEGYSRGYAAATNMFLSYIFKKEI